MSSGEIEHATAELPELHATTREDLLKARATPIAFDYIGVVGSEWLVASDR